MQIKFTRTVRNILGPGALVASIALLLVYNSAEMNVDSWEFLRAMAGYSGKALATTTGSSEPIKSEKRLAPLTRLTIEHCKEGTLWAPVCMALGVNAFAQLWLWLQSRHVGPIFMNSLESS